jgi:hypothetical protein
MNWMEHIYLLAYANDDNILGENINTTNKNKKSVRNK